MSEYFKQAYTLLPVEQRQKEWYEGENFLEQCWTFVAHLVLSHFFRFGGTSVLNISSAHLSAENYWLSNMFTDRIHPVDG